MKKIFFAYAIVSIFLVAAMSLLSYGYGAGYVYLFFRGWQVQTNVWVLLIFLAVLSFTVQMIWLFCKRYLTRKQRQNEQVFNFQQLHPYEKLAILWLLEAEQEKKGMVQHIFAQSGLLKEVVQASFLWKQQQFDTALDMLKQAPSNAFELAELQRIELYLAHHQGQEALAHLEFLNQHELSLWLKEIEHGYQAKLTSLWGRFAIQYPWLYLTSTQFGHLNEQDKAEWLKHILLTFEQSSSTDVENLKQRYLLMKEQSIYLADYDNKVLWLKILARLPDLSIEYEALVQHLLLERFNSEVFYMWFEQQLLVDSPDYLKIEHDIKKWEEKYKEVPIFSFAKWHLYQATHRYEDADKLLTLYPNHILMNYLRVKNKIKEDEILIQELNTIFESDNNFLKLKLS